MFNKKDSRALIVADSGVVLSVVKGRSGVRIPQPSLFVKHFFSTFLEQTY